MDIEITKVTSRGQVVIPQEIREHAKIKEGEKFLVYEVGGDLVLKRMSNVGNVRNTDEFERVFNSMWKTAKSRRITKKNVEKEIRGYRKEKHA